MTLVKHSARTVRKPCRQCGRSDLYWAHDTERAYHTTCDKCGVNGRFALMERDGSRHSCADTGQAPEASEAAPEPAAAPSASSDPAMQAFQAFMAAVAPKVDAGQVHQIVDEKLRGLVLPLRVQVTDPSGQVRDITGVSHKAFPAVLGMVQAGRKAGRPLHVYMHGPGGTGKTSIAPRSPKPWACRTTPSAWVRP